MDSLWQDIRFGFRALVKNAAFSLVIVLTLALGLGANAAIFASIDALIFRPFPMADADRIVMVGETTPTRDWVRESVSPANYLDWKAQSDAFEMLAASEWWDVNLSGRDEPERVQGFFVSADFFRIMDARPAIGRDFVRDDEQVGRQHQVIVGYGLWQRRFAGDPAIVGQTILLDATPYTVVGIAPEGFDFPIGCEIWAPLAFDPKTAAVRHDHYLTVVGRLKAAGSLAGAQAQMRAIGERLAQQYPESNRRRGARVVTLTEGMMDEGAGPFLAAWQVAALFVLLIGCANVANLLLARGAERQREIAVRLAMGATRGDLVRQLLVESVVLAMAAVPVSILLGALALVLAAVGVYSLMTYLIVQRTHEIGVHVALGTSRRDVLRLTLGQALRMTAAGLGLGLVLGVLVSRLMAGMVPGMAAVPPWMFASVAGGLGLVGLVAGYVPSLRALKVDPIIALRSE